MEIFPLAWLEAKSIGDDDSGSIVCLQPLFINKKLFSHLKWLFFMYMF